MSDTTTEVSPAAEAWMNGDMQGAQQLNKPIVDDQPQGGSSQAQDDIALAPTPDAPRGEAAFVERAATTLAELGPEGDALVQKWGGRSSHDFQENLSYAREAFKDIVTNRPDLIERVDASGLGNDPAILEFLAQHGRLQAGFMGDFTVARNGTPPSQAPVITRGGGSNAAARAELNKIYRDNPPGTPQYKQPEIQRRIRQLSEIVSGGGNYIVGTGTRTA